MENPLNSDPFRKKPFALSKRLPPILFFLLLWLLGYSQPMTLSRQLVFEKIGRQNTNVFLEDSFGFIWIGANGLFRYDGYDVQAYRPTPGDSMQILPGVVRSLFEDSKKRIWVGAANGLFQYDRETGQLKRRSVNIPKYQTPHSRILSIFEDSLGRLWIGDREYLYMMENPDVDDYRIIEGIDLDIRIQGASGFTSILQGENGEIYATSTNGLWLIRPDFTSLRLLPEKWEEAGAEFLILDAAAEGDSLLWLATSDGLWVFDSKKKTFSKKETPPQAGNVILRIIIDAEKGIWLGTKENGLFRLKEARFEHFPSEPDNPYSLSGDRIQALLIDRYSNLWVGAMTGIDRINFKQQKFPFYQIDPGPYRIDNYTHRIMQDSLGGLWLRLMRLGLGYSSGVGEPLEIRLQPESNTNIEEIKNFCVDPDGNVWVLTLTKGLYQFEKGTNQYRHIELSDSMQLAYAYHILSDRKEDRYIWFSSRLGLCRVDRFTYRRKWFPPRKDLPWLDTDIVGRFVQSEDGDFWCTLRTKGRLRIVYFDRQKNKFIAPPGLKEAPDDVYVDRNHHAVSFPGNKIWIATHSGVVIVDANSKTFSRLIPENGFPFAIVNSIALDLEGAVWFTGEYKICKYDGDAYHCFDARDHVEQFVSGSGALGSDGRLSFGGRNGVYSFYPDDITFEADTVGPKVYLTNFEVFNKRRRLGKAYELVREITLPFEENMITLEFSGLHFLHSNRFKYRHKLEPIEKEWVETDANDRRVTYTNLSPGKYTFKALAVNADGYETKEENLLELRLAVLPPWYRTRLAWVLYLLVGGFLLIGAWRYELRRQLTKAEAGRLKELDALKTQLYTNITHEFRTPLTVIMGMADRVAARPDQWLSQGLGMIKRNGQNLLRLINQMLDLSKLEAGKLQLDMVQGDVVFYLRYILDSFQSYATIKNIHVHFQSDVKRLTMDYDPDKLLNIVSNLLSNALKFTEPGGDVYLKVDGQTLKRSNGESLITHHSSLIIHITDTGVGVPEDKLPHIFDRFYQADNSTTRKGEGTGIGLALTKELVKLMGGEIKVKSKMNLGTEFTVILPITKEAPPVSVLEKRAIKDGIQAFPPFRIGDAAERKSILDNDLDKPVLLIVEDNKDVVEYLFTCLESDYQLEVAYDGQEGIDKALELAPDIIVSDVMMPKKDGFELCHTLKNDMRTSHIPIVLLTAKADVHSKIAGLRRGADAYLAKPFNEQELQVRMKQLLALRQKLRQKYAAAEYLTGSAPAPEKSDTPLEDEFILKIRQAVEEHLDDYDFDVSRLCREMGMSRSPVHNKLKALTGKSTTEFVRHIRLEKARELLLTSDLNISEVAYNTGFRNPAYFTKMFGRKFGLSPTEYRETVVKR